MRVRLRPKIMPVVAVVVLASAVFAIAHANAETDQRAVQIVQDKVSDYYGSLVETAVFTSDQSATVVLERQLGGSITNSELRSVIRNIYSSLLKIATIREVQIFVWRQDGNDPDVWHAVWHVVAKGKNAEWDTERSSFLQILDLITREMAPWQSSRPGDDRDSHSP